MREYPDAGNPERGSKAESSETSRALGLETGREEKDHSGTAESRNTFQFRFLAAK
jgi:hypothetical protein